MKTNVFKKDRSMLDFSETELVYQMRFSTEKDNYDNDRVTDEIKKTFEEK